MTGDAELLPFHADHSTAAMRQLRQKILVAYQQIAREWVDQVNSEVGLWGAINARIATAADGSEALAACEAIIMEKMALAAPRRPSAGESAKIIGRPVQPSK